MSSNPMDCIDISSVVSSLKRSPPGTKTDSSSCSTTLTSRELVLLAKAIANSKPPPTISKAIVELAEDVIDGRQFCADWYASRLEAGQLADDVKQQNESHLHFVAVLNEVLVILRTTRAKQQSEPKLSTSNQKRGHSPAQAKTVSAGLDSVRHLNNLFDRLELEEPATDHFLAAPKPQATQTPTETPSRPPLFRVEVVQTVDDMFELWCFLQDLYEVRLFVCTIWDDYRVGDLSLPAAGAISQTAFSLMRRTSKEFSQRHPDLAHYNGVLSRIGVKIPALGMVVFDQDAVRDELLCPPASQLLFHLAGRVLAWVDDTSIKKGWASESSRGYYEVPTIWGDDPFTQALLSRLPQLGRLTYGMKLDELGDPRDGTTDEFVVGLANYFRRTSHAPLWLVIAYQTYRDIYDRIGVKASVGAHLILEAHRGYVGMCQQYLQDYGEGKFRDRSFSATWMQYLEDISQGVPKYIEHVEAALAAYEKNLPGPDPFCQQSGPAVFRVTCILPLLGCKMVDCMGRELYKHGIHIANDGYTVLSVAYLYRALRHFNLITKAWHDMDFIISQQSSEKAFVTKTNAKADPYAIARHFQIAMGVPLSTYVRTKRPNLPTPYKMFDDARKITPTSPLLNKLVEKNREPGSSERATHDIIGATLEALTLGTQKSTRSRKKKAGVTPDTKHMTPVQLLSTFKSLYVADEPTVNFDYIGFFMICARLLGGVRHFVADLLGHKDIDRGYKAVDWLFWNAGDTIDQGRSMQNSYLVPVAEEMRSLIESEGNRFSKEAYDRCSGRIPKSKRPQFEKPDKELRHS